MGWCSPGSSGLSGLGLGTLGSVWPVACVRPRASPLPRLSVPCCQSGRAGYLGAVSCKVSSIVAIIITATTVSPEPAGAVLSPR